MMERRKEESGGRRIEPCRDEEQAGRPLWESAGGKQKEFTPLSERGRVAYSAPTVSSGMIPYIVRHLWGCRLPTRLAYWRPEDAVSAVLTSSAQDVGPGGRASLPEDGDLTG